MLPRTLGTYGAPFVDAIPVDDPTTTESSSQHNRLTEDVAQGTRTWDKAWVHFLTATSNGAIVATSGQSIFGVGSGQLPTIARTGTGLYTITYPNTWTDGLGLVENVVFVDGDASVMSASVLGRAQIGPPAGSVISVLVIANVSGTDTASDLGGGVMIRVLVK
jgi:hypothetical protein